MLLALRDGLKLADRTKIAKIAGDNVALVYGRQLQQKEDERPAGDELDVASTTNDEIAALKRDLVAERPDAARALGMG